MCFGAHKITYLQQLKKITIIHTYLSHTDKVQEHEPQYRLESGNARDMGFRFIDFQMTSL